MRTIELGRARLRFLPCASSHALALCASCLALLAAPALRARLSSSSSASPAAGRRLSSSSSASPRRACLVGLRTIGSGSGRSRFQPCVSSHALALCASSLAPLASPASPRLWLLLAPFGRAFLAAPLVPHFPRQCTADLLEVGVLVCRVAHDLPLRGWRRGRAPLAPPRTADLFRSASVVSLSVLRAVFAWVWARPGARLNSSSSASRPALRTSSRSASSVGHAPRG
jgi:hypothetical protein